MHKHPANVGVHLTDGNWKFTFPDGKTEDFTPKAGETGWSEGETHFPENLSEEPVELILVEIK